MPEAAEWSLSPIAGRPRPDGAGQGEVIPAETRRDLE
jgi:hypothetical protein